MQLDMFGGPTPSAATPPNSQPVERCPRTLDMFDPSGPQDAPRLPQTESGGEYHHDRDPELAAALSATARVPATFDDRHPVSEFGVGAGVDGHAAKIVPVTSGGGKGALLVRLVEHCSGGYGDVCR